MSTKWDYQQRFTDLPDTRVTHTVSVVPVGLKFHENGTLVKGRKRMRQQEQDFFCCFSNKVKYSKSPCQICSVQRQTWWLPGHTEHPFHPPENKLIQHAYFHQNAWRISVIQVILKFSSTVPLMCDKTDRLARESCSVNSCLNGNWRRYPEAWNEVSSLVVVCAGCGSLHGCAHTISVVLTDEDGRELPECSHVVGFKNLTLRSTRKYQSMNVTKWLPQRVLSQFLAAPRT